MRSDEQNPAASPGPPARLASTPTEPDSAPPPPMTDQWDTLNFRFVPGRIRISPVYVALTYRLQIDNRAQETAGPLRIRADMISAHASRPNSEQLSLDRDRAEAVHAVAVLLSGAGVSLTGELRMPLSEVRQILSGGRAIFVPLVRFLIEQEGAEAECTRVFTLGQPHGDHGDRMMPLRFDLGPRIIWHLDSREVEVHRWLPPSDFRKAS